MTQPVRRVDLSLDPLALSLITDGLIASIAEKLRSGQDSSADKQVLFQLFIADIRSQQVQEPTPKEEEEEQTEEKE